MNFQLRVTTLWSLLGVWAPFVFAVESVSVPSTSPAISAPPAEIKSEIDVEESRKAVRAANDHYNEAVRQYGKGSQQAKAAETIWNEERRRLEKTLYEQGKVPDAVKPDTTKPNDVPDKPAKSPPARHITF